jgi:hypothetical protein
MATSNVFEKHETYDGVLSSDCEAEADLFLPAQIPELSELSEGDLGPLTSQMIRMTFHDFPLVHISNASGDSNIDFNIYQQGSCSPLPDVFRGQDGSFYGIVLVNTSFNSSAHFKVNIEVTATT